MPSKTATGMDHDEVELNFLLRIAELRPRDVVILKAVADQLTRCGRHVEGLEADLRLAGLCPDDDLVFYNLACSLALTGKTEEALSALGKAVELGYDDDVHAVEDGDLSSLRSDPRFEDLLLAMRISADREQP